MAVEPIGLIVLLIGLVAIFFSSEATIFAVIILALLQASAAVIIGKSNIQPAHLMLGFAAISCFMNREKSAHSLEAIKAPRAGFWLTAMVIYSVISSFIVPRMLAGSISILPLGSSEYGGNGAAVPLGPVSGNVTQSIYLLADLMCFVIVSASVKKLDGLRSVVSAIIAYAFANFLFAIVDVVTYVTGTQYLVSFIHNATYDFHLEEEISGLKRIAGSFTEASSFAYATLGALCFTGTMWLCNQRPLINGPLALISLLLVVFSTSSTGLASLPVVFVLLYGTALRMCGTSRNGRNSAAMLLIAPLIVMSAVLFVILSPKLSSIIIDHLNTLIFNKGTSESGIERGRLNSAALQNFWDSGGFGVGLGTVRTSSFLIALLSNVGAIGSLFYILFILTAFRVSVKKSSYYVYSVNMSARNGCVGLIVASSASGTLVDQGLMFYVFAALAYARPQPQESNI